jgi:hypothetical protein
LWRRIVATKAEEIVRTDKLSALTIARQIFVIAGVLLATLPEYPRHSAIGFNVRLVFSLQW